MGGNGEFQVFPEYSSHLLRVVLRILRVFLTCGVRIPCVFLAGAARMSSVFSVFSLRLAGESVTTDTVVRTLWMSKDIHVT